MNLIRKKHISSSAEDQAKAILQKLLFSLLSLFLLGLNNPAGMMKENQSSIAVKRGELYFIVEQSFVIYFSRLHHTFFERKIFLLVSSKTYP